MFAGATRALKEVAVLEAFTPGIMLTNFILCTLQEHTGEQQAEERKEKPSVSIKMISPAQATLEQAQSELKKQNKQKRGRRNPVST